MGSLIAQRCRYALIAEKTSARQPSAALSVAAASLARAANRSVAVRTLVPGHAKDRYFLALREPHHQPLPVVAGTVLRSEEHTSELQSRENLVCRLLLEKK